MATSSKSKLYGGESFYTRVLESSSHHAGSTGEQDEPISSSNTATVDPAALSSGERAYYHLKQGQTALTFGWMRPLLEVGNTRRLEPSDLYPLRQEDTASHCFDKFMHEWRQVSASPNASLTWSFLSAFGGPFLYAGVLKLGHDCLIFVGPSMLNKLIIFLRSDAPLSEGLFYVAILGVSQFVMSVLLRQYFFECFRVGLRLRSTVITTLFAKTMRISPEVFTRKSSGEIQNIMAIDSTRLQDLTGYLHAIWFAAFQIACALYLLWGQMGPSSIAAILVIVWTMPVTAKVSKMLKDIQQKVSAVRDERLKITTELLKGIKAIKYQAWEERMRERVNKLRDQEMTLFRQYVLTQALSGTLFTVIPLIVSITTFAAFTLSGHTLDVATALTSLSLLDLLRFPLFMLPSTLNSLVEAKVSVDRVQAFLQEAERTEVGIGSLTHPGVQFSKASLVWEGQGRKHWARKPASTPLQKLSARIFKFFIRAAGGKAGDEEGADESDVGTGNPINNNSSEEVEQTRKKVLVQMPAAEYEQVLSVALATESEEYIESLEGRIAELSGRVQEVEESETTKQQQQQQRILALSRISLNLAPGSLVAVIGQVASGKSSLISSVLGELRILFGSVVCRGSVAFVGQRPFIFNATVRDNILNGLPFYQAKYDETISSCALLADFRVLPAGDLTEIGERGINLSGGQKARVALARAVYNDADVYLLDDVLSAVDSHTAAHIIDKVILALLAKNKAVLLATNALQVLPLCSKIHVLENGRVSQSGTFAQLKGTGGLFEVFGQAFSRSFEAGNGDQLDNQAEQADQENQEEQEEGGEKKQKQPVVALQSETTSRDEKPSSSQQQQQSAAALVLVEERELGHVKKGVYLEWLRAAGGWRTGLLMLVLFTASEASNVSTSIWLSVWSENNASYSTSFFLGIYILLNVVIASMMLMRELVMRLCAWTAGRTLFRELLDSILLAPMNFFDTTPLGRISNRFSKDIYTLDESLPQTIRWYLQSMAKVVGAILYVIVVTPLFLVALVPIILFYIRTQRYYIKTSRELARLDNISRSPIYALFGETIDGLSTIRAYKMEERLSARNARLLDENQRAYFLTFSANCWLAFRLEFAGTLIVVIASALAVLGRPSGSSSSPRGGAGTSVETYAGLAGLAISLTLSITQSINWSVRMASDLESQMVSVERIHDYICMEKEKPHHTAGDPPPSWPSRGDITFENVSMRYREGLPLVLRSVSLEITGRSKIGVVGRTGSGKSSLVAALLRLVEISSGRVLIDGIDVGSIGLFALRSRISVIPQDPVLFAGTIRLNVDPFNQHTDLVLSETLREVGLVGVSLNDNVEDEGANLSVGQRQIICIARALVEKAAIIVMDEATASVDIESDALIQSAIRRISHSATTITVAHRLNTILDSDKVLVMSDGCVAEFDTPARLLERRDSLFAALVSEWRGGESGASEQ